MIAVWLLAMLGLGFLNWHLVKHLSAVKATSFASVVSTCNFTFSSCGLLLTLLDIQLVTNRLESEQSELKVLSYATVFLSLLFATFVTPIAYYYSEDSHEMYEADSNSERFWDSLKFAGMFLFFIVLLVCVALVVQHSSHDWSSLVLWLEEVVDSKHHGSAILMCIAVLVKFFGCILWSYYVGYGLAILPLSLVTRSPSLTELSEEIDSKLEITRVKQRELYAGQAAQSKNKSSSYEAEEAKLIDKRQKLRSLIESSNETTLLTLARSSCTFIGKICLSIFTVFLASGLFTSLGSINVNKLLYSECGFKCGFTMNSSGFFSPFDLLLANLSSHAAFLVFAISLGLLHLVAVYALSKLGVGICGIKCCVLKRSESHAQAILIASVLSSFLALVTYSQIAAAAPNFAAYGGQVIDSELGKTQCSLSQLQACKRTLSSTFGSELSQAYPLMSSVVMCSDGLTFTVFVASCFFQMCRCSKAEDADLAELESLVLKDD